MKTILLLITGMLLIFLAATSRIGNVGMAFTNPENMTNVSPSKATSNASTKLNQSLVQNGV